MIHAVGYLVTIPSSAGDSSVILTGTPLQKAATDWLSPPDHAVNYHTACESHHEGTATWFIEGTIFKDWKQSGSLFWIHGKRAFPFPVRLACNN